MWFRMVIMTSTPVQSHLHRCSSHRPIGCSPTALLIRRVAFAIALVMAASAAVAVAEPAACRARTASSSLSTFEPSQQLARTPILSFLRGGLDPPAAISVACGPALRNASASKCNGMT